MLNRQYKKRQLYKDKNKVLDHWHKRHNERDHEKLMKLAEYELYNFAWIAAVNTFIEQGRLSDRKKVLDVGFGWGRMIVGLKERFPDMDITGIEIVETAIENAYIILDRYLGNYSKIKLEIGDVQSLKYEDNRFDAVFSTRVFQYLSNPQKAIDHVYRVLIPGGRAVIMVPNKINPYLYLWYHTKLISSFTLKKWFRNAGFKDIKVGSIVFFNDKWYCFSSDSAWVKIERFFTRIPLLNRIGGNVWVSGEK